MPAGKHIIDFKFEPKVYIVGEKISLASTLILILMLIIGIGYGIKGYLKQKPNN